MSKSIFSKLEEIRQALNATFYERENEVDGILVALLSKQHMLMIGPAGTAKSALSVELATIIKDSTYFQWLLTKFSTPEELFGPLSLRDLEKGVYKRVTTTKMPEATIVFLDEIFKANSAILNSLLTLLNERVFYNDGSPTTVPLMTVIGSSNEYPEEEEGLEALFDRFLLRFEIDFIVDETNFIAMMKDSKKAREMPSMTLDELVYLQQMTEQVVIPDEVVETVSRIRTELRDEGIRPSDRRFKHSLCVLQATAILNQREVVQLEDIHILENALWVTIEQKGTVSTIIRKYAQDGLTKALTTIHNEATEVFYAILQDQSSEMGMEATQKMNALVATLNVLVVENDNRADEVNETLHKVTAMQNKVLDSILEPWTSDASTNKTISATNFFKM